MKILLSLNFKFFNLEPERLIEFIKKYNKENLIAGFEISTNSKKDELYVLKLAKIALKNEYIINLHSPSFENMEDAKKYLSFAVEISKIMQRKTNIVYHPINAKSINESKEKTKEQIKEIMQYIEDKKYYNKVELSIENLNDINGIKRLKKEDLIEILEGQKSLKLTYDIGHEIIDGIKTERLVNILDERLNNIHIHTFHENLDHYPIKNINEQETIRKLLEKYGYNKTVVLEYAIDYIEGENFETKLKKYVESAKIIKGAVTTKENLSTQNLDF